MVEDTRTMAAKLKIENIANTNIDHSEEALIPPFELALVKYLYRNNGRVLDSTKGRFVNKPRDVSCNNIGLHIKALVPVRV
jgi:hypothetical protein